MSKVVGKIIELLTAAQAVPDENAVTVLNTSSRQVLSRIYTGNTPLDGTEPNWLLIVAEGDQLFVLNELSDSILFIDIFDPNLNLVIEVINLASCRIILPLTIHVPNGQ